MSRRSADLGKGYSNNLFTLPESFERGKSKKEGSAMNEDSSANFKRTTMCPACKKQITEQAPVEIPTSKMQINRARDEIAGTALGNIFYRNGKYYLVFETMCCCPYCETF